MKFCLPELFITLPQLSSTTQALTPKSKDLVTKRQNTKHIDIFTSASPTYDSLTRLIAPAIALGRQF